ncbi:uncharacterized protein KD926_002878 [Aspergillus affinis]|uniref:uncharacterized protein n=1 Tax=Aspergillus affinis TaxID=1070780 RepID=UPI0022FE3FE4|nr:uncharacterized protein KD926_002878 [Aspergillus affinis]KAI9035814.1 hypothetical protein KD926_002878 [Aspergillus affinis]
MMLSADTNLLIPQASGIKTGNAVCPIQTQQAHKSYLDFLDSEEVIGTGYTYVLWGGDAFQDDGLVWDIFNEKGQIRITGARIMFNISADNYKIHVKDYANGKIETVPMHEKLPLPLLAQKVGMVHERFADGEFDPTFEDAVFASNQDGGSVQAFGFEKWGPL